MIRSRRREREPVTFLVIAKKPKPGAVKTRLCPPCTPEEAADIAAAALADTLAAVSRTPAGRRVVVLDGEPGPWLPSGFDVVAQTAGGLDRRLAGAFAVSVGPAVLVGMDTPQCTPADLARAADLLCTRGVDAVLGPAADGGFWAIGLRAARPEVFLGIEMSTPRTGAAQRARLAELGLRTRLLPVQRDVDRYSDARAVAASIPASSFAAAVARVDGRLRHPSPDAVVVAR
jgi:rSAM/selenodomain-associated transferase 1